MNKFRDTLFKRYSDVSFLLRSMKFRDLPDFIQTMYQEIQEEELWTIYLSNPFREGSFKDWKESLIKGNRSKEEIETDATQAAAKALELLNGLGGDLDGG